LGIRRLNNYLTSLGVGFRAKVIFLGLDYYIVFWKLFWEALWFRPKNFQIWIQLATGS